MTDTTLPSTKVEAVLWLWRAHNTVSVGVNATDGRIESGLGVAVSRHGLFPDATLCPECMVRTGVKGYWPRLVSSRCQEEDDRCECEGEGGPCIHPGLRHQRFNQSAVVAFLHHHYAWSRQSPAEEPAEPAAVRHPDALAPVPPVDGATPPVENVASGPAAGPATPPHQPALPAVQVQQQEQPYRWPVEDAPFVPRPAREKEGTTLTLLLFLAILVATSIGIGYLFRRRHQGIAARPWRPSHTPFPSRAHLGNLSPLAEDDEGESDGTELTTYRRGPYDDAVNGTGVAEASGMDSPEHRPLAKEDGML